MQKDNRDDRINTLPSDVLVNILDRLDVREAVRTSILSRRWSRLSCKLSRLIINAQPDGVSCSNISDGDFVRINAAVVEATKSLLTRRYPGEDTIHLLTTTFYLRGDVPISIGHAVGSAMTTHNIEKAEFTVLTVKKRRQCTLDDVLNYGSQFVSFFNECLNAFTGLTRLYMENLRFAESDFVSNIFVTCKRLKYLGFLNCDTENHLTLQVEHAQLSELIMVNCRFYKVKLK
uniref:F-box domain-containing protein n=1 Tax=Hordeum vulgare subsp. vulgare TaxID=112509 RepID=A0A8I6XKK8_HORVV